MKDEVKEKRKGCYRDCFLVLPALFFLCCTLSCDSTQTEFSSQHCYFVFDNSVHNDATVAAAMTPYSGVFVTVTVVSHGGARYFRFVSNQGTSSETIFNAIDGKRTLLLGMNGGLIVGYGVLSEPLTFYAFDRECPNCYNDSRIPVVSYPLQVSASGIGFCASCRREYNLNTGGNIVSGDAGSKLTRYRASTTGAYGVLSAN